MTPEDFNKLFADTVTKLQELARLKGGEYAPGKDRLANFKEQGAALGLPPEAIWAVYAGKHWDSIRTYTRDLIEGKTRERSESIEGRYHDLIVYCVLAIGLLRDREARFGIGTPLVIPTVAKPQDLSGY
jgi:hypothetical protein